MKPIEFTKSFQGQEYYAGENVEISYDDRIWASILLHLADRPGTINAETIRQELFPALPDYACANLISELEFKGYLEYDDYGTLVLTEQAQIAIATGKLWMPLPEDKVVKFQAVTCKDFNEEVTLLNHKGVYIEDKGVEWNANSPCHLSLSQTTLPAKNGKDCLVDLGSAKIRRRTKSNAKASELKLQIGEHATLKLDENTCVPLEIALDRTQLIQRQFSDYDPQADCVRRRFDASCIYGGVDLKGLKLECTDLENLGWKLKPQQIDVLPADAESARLAYLAELARRLANFSQLTDIEAQFVPFAEKLADELSQKWQTELAPVNLTELEQILDKHRPVSFLRMTAPVKELTWRGRQVSKVPLDLNTTLYTASGRTMLAGTLTSAQLVSSAREAVFMLLPYWPQAQWLCDELVAAVHRGVRFYLVMPRAAFDRLSPTQRQFLSLHTLARFIDDEQPALSLVLADPHLESGLGMVNTGCLATHSILQNETSKHDYMTQGLPLEALHRWFVQTLLSAPAQLDAFGSVARIKPERPQPQAQLIGLDGLSEPLWDAIESNLLRARSCQIELSLCAFETLPPFFDLLREAVAERECQVRLVLPKGDDKLRKQLAEAQIELEICNKCPNRLLISGNCELDLYFTPDWCAAGFASSYGLGLIALPNFGLTTR